jgi:hypothetical protein
LGEIVSERHFGGVQPIVGDVDQLPQPSQRKPPQREFRGGSHAGRPSRIALPQGGQRKTTLFTSPRTTDSVSSWQQMHGPLMTIVPGAIGV